MSPSGADRAWNDGVRVAIARASGRLVGALSRRLSTGEGMTMSGTTFLALVSPRLAASVARTRRSVLVSGTNGKTTTTALIARAAETAGPVASNRSGANLGSGVFAALVESWDAELAVLEVDELALPAMIRIFEPEVVAALNLTRDQLDRTHEVRRTASLWREAFAEHRGIVVANADDPLVVWSVRGSRDVVWVAAGRSWLVDAHACPDCSSPIAVDADGRWRCTACSLCRPNVPAVRVAPPTGMPGRCNESNAAVAFAVLEELGLDASTAGWMDVTSVEGRYERRTIDGRDVRLLLAKNPAGWLEALDLVDDGSPLVLALNSHAEDGADPSWIWDVPFERLAGRSVVCSGERAADLAVRLSCAGVEVSTSPDITTAVLEVAIGPVDVVANYSAFRDAREHLLTRG